MALKPRVRLPISAFRKNKKKKELDISRRSDFHGSDDEVPALTEAVSADEEAHCRGLQSLIRFVRVGSDLFPVLSDLKPGKKEEILFHTADVREDLVADFRELLTRLVFHRSVQFVSSGPA